MTLSKSKSTKLVCLLVLLMILSSVSAGQANASAVILPSKATPLTCRNYQSRQAMWKQNDISTSEILGIRNTLTLLEYNVRQTRRRLSYHHIDTDLKTLSYNPSFFTYKMIVSHSLNEELDSQYKIIRYIHDQDGEKDNLFHYE